MDDVDPSPKNHTRYKDSLEKENSLRLEGFIIKNNPLYEDIPFIQFKENHIHEEIFKVNNPLYKPLDDFNSNMIHVNSYETPNKPLFTVSGFSTFSNPHLLNKPLFVVQGGYSNDAFCIPSKPIITMQGGYPTKSPFEYAKQNAREIYNSVADIYNMQNNRQPNPPLVIPSSLPTSQPILPLALSISQTLGKEYDVIEQLKATPAKISALDLIHFHPHIMECYNMF